MASAVSASRGQEAPEEDAAAHTQTKETVVAPAALTGGASKTGHAAHNRDVFLQPDPETRTLTHDWFGFGDNLREHGVTSTLNFWITYQGNVTGGLSNDDAANGLYWFANHFDLERLLGLPGGSAYFLVEGGWNEGINDSVGSIMNVNGTAVGDEPIGVTRLWYDQNLFDERLRFRLGKIDVTSENFEFHGRSVAFDAMAYANTPRTQFLDAGLINNASVPFPAAGLTAMLIAEPVDRWYVAAAGFDRQSDSFDWSYSNAFDDWMVVAETGIVAPLGRRSLTGHYYVGYWYSTFPSAPDGQGLYLGMAQELYREPGSSRQGLGVFARYGYGDRSVDGIQHYWSLGVQYQGLVPWREDDILALGWAQVCRPGSSSATVSEGALELYYRVRLTPWLHISPHMQYIENPGTSGADDALTFGVRGQITF
jgi:carbohydrate-selective porin OprB